METFAIYSYTAATLSYSVFFCFAFIRIHKNSVLSIPTVITLFFSILWSGYTVFILQNNQFYIQEAFPVESLRNLAWFVFLSILLSKQQFDQPYYLLKNSIQVPILIILTVSIVILESVVSLRYIVQSFMGFDFRLFVHISFSILGLILVEQLYRNALYEQRWAIKFICLSLAAIFMYDFVLYSKSLLFNTLDTVLWEARGFVNASVIPLIALSLMRLSTHKLKLKVSNKVIFHSTVLLGTGCYLVLMSLAGYFLKFYGGSWGGIFQISFIFLALILLLVFFISGTLRAQARVYFGKHFFQHRYDYREEWIKLSQTLSGLNSVDELCEFIVRTMVNTVDSSGGGLWLVNEQGDFFLVEAQNLNTKQEQQQVLKNDPLIHFLLDKQWVVDFVEYFNDPDLYSGLDLNDWHEKLHDIWLIIPLIRQGVLEAFVVLTEPKVYRTLDWQDTDLLKTISIQLINALALSQASDDLSRAKQFEAYNRFSAFLVHDLKNLVAQIALIVKNSEKHKRNPEFIDDSIETLEHVVKKIDTLLKQLKKGNIQGSTGIKINVNNVLDSVILQQASNLPVITIESDCSECWVMGDEEKMIAILGHLVQNAQDATDDRGSVKIILKKQLDKTIVKIIDTGCGMDEKFIQQRLFKPFDTTKGNAGMGIGVYEAREYILQQSGQIEVQSIVGEGTVFSLYFPSLD